MINKPKKPIKKWNSFLEFFQIKRNEYPFSSVKITKTANGAINNLYPCLECKGNGTIYDPDDPPCSIEGNKCRRRIYCQECKSSGIGVEKDWLDWYNNEEVRFKEVMVEFSRKFKLWSSIKKKLSPEELKFIGFSESEENYY